MAQTLVRPLLLTRPPPVQPLSPPAPPTSLAQPALATPRPLQLQKKLPPPPPPRAQLCPSGRAWSLIQSPFPGPPRTWSSRCSSSRTRRLRANREALVWSPARARALCTGASQTSARCTLSSGKRSGCLMPSRFRARCSTVTNSSSGVRDPAECAQTVACTWTGEPRAVHRSSSCLNSSLPHTGLSSRPPVFTPTCPPARPCPSGACSDCQPMWAPPCLPRAPP